MNYGVVEARYVGGYDAWLRLRDDTSGEIDPGSELYGPVFEPLRRTSGLFEQPDRAVERGRAQVHVALPFNAAHELSKSTQSNEHGGQPRV